MCRSISVIAIPVRLLHEYTVGNIIHTRRLEENHILQNYAKGISNANTYLLAIDRMWINKPVSYTHLTLPTICSV